MNPLGRLSVIDPAGKRREVVLEKYPFTMGRLGDNDLLLRDSRISRHHAQIVREDSHLTLVDLGSRHGTFVNGQKVERHRLAPDDRIEFGVSDSYVLIFSSDQPTVSKLLDKFKAPAETGPVSDLQHLGVLLEVSRALHAALSLDDVLVAMVDASLEVARAERGCLLLKDTHGKLKCAVARDRAKASLNPDHLKLSQSVIERAMQTRRHVIHTDVGLDTDESLAAQRSIADLELKTLICVPLLKMQMTNAVETIVSATQAEVIGLLYMDSRQPTSAFTDTSREILQSLCIEASAVVENATLLEAARESEKLQQELQIARDIQQGLLPKKFPADEHLECTGINVACHEVGGDYFDVFPLEGGACGVVVADVSGKGMSAALLASMLQGVFWATAVSGASPAEVAHRVNAYVCERTSCDKYATLFYGILEPQGVLRYVNAGHTTPMLVATDRQVHLLPSENLPIGMFNFARYTESSITMEPGSTLVLYTDGVTEAVNADEEMYGETQLKEALMMAAPQPVEQLRDHLLTAVRGFVAGHPQNDDITMVVIRRK